jgi:hypothetical protein
MSILYINFFLIRKSCRSDTEECGYVLRYQITSLVSYFAATSTTASISSSLLSNVNCEGFPSSQSSEQQDDQFIEM